MGSVPIADPAVLIVLPVVTGGLIVVEIAEAIAVLVVIAAAAEIVDRVAMAIATAARRPAETAEICRYHRRRFHSAWQRWNRYRAFLRPAIARNHRVPSHT